MDKLISDAVKKAIEDYLSKETEAREIFKDALDNIHKEVTTAYENLPRNMRLGKRGDFLIEDLEALENILGALENDPYYMQINHLKDVIGIEE